MELGSSAEKLVGNTQPKTLVGAHADSDLALPGDSLEVLREKNKRLRAKLQTMRWPRLQSFVAGGQVYTLPQGSHGHVRKGCLPLLPTSTLKYLSGFFDGDGCVIWRDGSCALEVAQSYDAADILVHYQHSFDGGICRMGSGAGLRKPTLKWHLSNAQLVPDVALSMRDFSITKKRQLAIAACRQNSAADGAELRSLKKYDSAVASQISWEYVAGFFDADGCIQPKGKASLCLALVQKHITVLECLNRFLKSETGYDAVIRRHKSCHVLEVYQTTTCQHILQSMLSAGMVRKRQQAELALDLNLAKTDEDRDCHAGLVGNQMFGKRLDDAGRQRARKITTTRARATCAARGGRHGQALILFEELELLKSNHSLQKALLENSELSAYFNKMQDMLQECASTQDMSVSPGTSRKLGQRCGHTNPESHPANVALQGS